MSGGAVLAIFMLFAIGGALVLYSLVRSEAENRQQMDRTSAERVARRDRGDEDEKMR